MSYSIAVKYDDKGVYDVQQVVQTYTEALVYALKWHRLHKQMGIIAIISIMDYAHHWLYDTFR